MPLKKTKSPKQTQKLFKKIAKILKPPPKLTVSQWADKFRKLPPEASAEPGSWRTSRAPYQREIMDSLNDPTALETVVMSSSQVGKTEILLNIIGFYVSYDPSPILIVQPTERMSEDFSKDRLSTMIRDCPILTQKVEASMAKSSNNTILHKIFPGGHLTIIGANSPAGLASRPIRILLCDEVDRFPASAGTEGDPVLLAAKRTATFWNRRILKVSTPTIEGTSRIETDYLASSQGEWCLPCPSCGEYQPLSFQRLKFESAEMECLYCKALHNQFAWKRDNQKNGRWIHKSPENPIRGFHLNAMASPWTKWEAIIEDFLKSKDNPLMLQTFINTVLGETWIDRSDSIDENALESHLHRYNCQVPDGVLFLSTGIDIQADRLEIEVVGWGEGEESWGIEYAILLGDPRGSSVWKSLDEFLFKPFHYADGRKINIGCTCIDSGFCADEVYQYCRQRENLRVFATKGKGGNLPMTDRPKRNNKYKAALFILGVDSLKDLFHSRLKIKHEGAGYCHFPVDGHAGYTPDILKGFISEQKIREPTKTGAYRYVWKKKGGVRNEPLDCRVYAIAALKIINPNFENLKNARQNKGHAPTQQQRGARILSKGVTL